MFSIRRSIRTAGVTAVVATLAVLSFGVAGTAQASASTSASSKTPISQVAVGTKAAAATVHGCAAGDVCIYPSAGWNGDRPSFHWAAYGAHNLSNQYGTHRVFNNQTGGAIAYLCTGYDGTGTYYGPIYAGYYVDYNLTPINSVFLAP
jgi:hypothetical protein